MSQRKELSSSLTGDTRKGLDAESRLGSKYLPCRLCTPGVGEAKRTSMEPLGREDMAAQQEKDGTASAWLLCSLDVLSGRTSPPRGEFSSTVEASGSGMALGGTHIQGEESALRGLLRKLNMGLYHLPFPLPGVLFLQLLPGLAASQPSFRSNSKVTSSEASLLALSEVSLHHCPWYIPYFLPGTYHNLNIHCFCIFLLKVSLSH